LELLDVAPGWYLSHNQFGFVIDNNRLDEKIKHYQTVSALNPDSYIGYYNLACVYSLQGNFAECIASLKKILENKKSIEAYCFQPTNLIMDDDDFENVIADKQHNHLFFYKFLYKLTMLILYTLISTGD